MAWSKKLTQLNEVLADLIPHYVGIEKYIRAAGIRPQMVSFNGTATDIWNSVISEADKIRKVDNLIKAVLEHYPDNPLLLTALEEEEVDYSSAPELDEISVWKAVDEDTLEVLTSATSTMLPISFLENGIIKSKSVGKVQISCGRDTCVGTGFLFKVKDSDPIRFMTNFHVLSDKSKFVDTAIIFDFELDSDGNSKKSKSFVPDVDEALITSKISELDVSIFSLKDEKGELEEFGYLKLSRTNVEKSDFVNVIQHPGGQMKQISLYHNVVTYSDSRIVQYLTDTLKGSSGSPVFNSKWEVVAIHHSGGKKKATEARLPASFKNRNEGIFVNAILDFLEDDIAKKKSQ